MRAYLCMNLVVYYNVIFTHVARCRWCCGCRGAADRTTAEILDTGLVFGANANLPSAVLQYVADMQLRSIRLTSFRYPMLKEPL